MSQQSGIWENCLLSTYKYGTSKRACTFTPKHACGGDILGDLALDEEACVDKCKEDSRCHCVTMDVDLNARCRLETGTSHSHHGDDVPYSAVTMDECSRGFGDLRLTTYPRGRLQISGDDGKWHDLCGHYFWDNGDVGAEAACKKMGYVHGKFYIMPANQSYKDTEPMYVGRCEEGQAPGFCTGGSGSCPTNAISCANCGRGSHSVVEIECSVSSSCSPFSSGDGTSSYETFIGNACSPAECILMVRENSTTANGVTMSQQILSNQCGECYAEFNQYNTHNEDSSEWTNCRLIDHYSQWSCETCLATSGYSFCEWDHDGIHRHDGCLPDVANEIHSPCGREAGDETLLSCGDNIS